MESKMGFVKITPKTMIAQIEEIPSTYIGEEIAFMNAEKSKYYGLDSVGTSIWKAIEEAKTVDGIVEDLLMEYDVERKTCVENVLEFLQELYEEGLVRIVPETE